MAEPSLSRPWRTWVPLVLITLGLLVPAVVAVTFPPGPGAPRAAARVGLPLSVGLGLVGVVLAWRSGLARTPLRGVLLVAAAAVLLALGAMMVL